VLTNIVRLDCDKCGTVLEVNPTDKTTVRATERWIAVRRQHGEQQEEYQVCSGACLRGLADAIMEEVIAQTKV